jgi:hypothetical protein
LIFFLHKKSERKAVFLNAEPRVEIINDFVSIFIGFDNEIVKKEEVGKK